MFKNPISDCYIDLRIKDGPNEIQSYVIPDSPEQLVEFMQSDEWQTMINNLAQSAKADFEKQAKVLMN